MVRRLGAALAWVLFATSSCHEGDQRGVGSIAADGLIGCWHGPSGELVSVTNAVYSGPPFLADETHWVRETRTLISVSDPVTGVLTIQTDFAEDLSRVDLRYTIGLQVQHLQLSRTEPNDAGVCQ